MKNIVSCLVRQTPEKLLDRHYHTLAILKAASESFAENGSPAGGTMLVLGTAELEASDEDLVYMITGYADPNELRVMADRLKELAVKIENAPSDEDIEVNVDDNLEVIA